MHKLVLLAPANGLRPIGSMLGFGQVPNENFLNLAKMVLMMMPTMLDTMGTAICGSNAYSASLTLPALESLISR